MSLSPFDSNYAISFPGYDMQSTLVLPKYTKNRQAVHVTFPNRRALVGDIEMSELSSRTESDLAPPFWWHIGENYRYFRTENRVPSIQISGWSNYFSDGFTLRSRKLVQIWRNNYKNTAPFGFLVASFALGSPFHCATTQTIKGITTLPVHRTYYSR